MGFQSVTFPPDVCGLSLYNLPCFFISYALYIGFKPIITFFRRLWLFVPVDRNSRKEVVVLTKFHFMYSRVGNFSLLTSLSCVLENLNVMT